MVCVLYSHGVQAVLCCVQAEAGADPLVKMRGEVDRLLEALAAIETEVSQLQNERVSPQAEPASVNQTAFVANS